MYESRDPKILDKLFKNIAEFHIDHGYDTYSFEGCFTELVQGGRGLNFFSGKNPPTAVFLHDDYLTAIIKCLLDKMGIRIPEELSIIAPGDVLDYNQPFLSGITRRISSLQT